MLILPSFKVGDTAVLSVARELSCTVTPPSGASYVIDDPRKRVSIVLAEPGTWGYEFSDGSTGELEVADAPTPRAAP